jgi:DNA-binding response OmpR family regulator
MAGIQSFYSDNNLGACGNPVPLMVPAKAGGDSKARVLVLEDDVLQLQLLTEHLQSVGMAVTSSSTIAEAKHNLEHGKFDLAIFDIQLPDGSGLDLCNEVADDSRFSGLPTIVLSSLSQSNIVRRTRAAGGSFFISKPYDPNVLLTVIERALGTTLD